MTHPFEAVGLGRAPYEFLEVEYTPDGDQCEFCGTRIKYRYWIQSGCGGWKFTVGSECVRKVDKQLAKECSRALNEYKRELAMSEEERAFYAGFESVKLSR